MEGYNQQRASEYDEKSHFDKGDRERHKLYLEDVLCFFSLQVKQYLELGCGTGYYSDVLLQAFPEATGHFVDGSEPMLEQFNKRIDSTNVKTTVADFESLSIHERWPNLEFVFSGVSLSCLSLDERFKSYQQIYQALNDGGVFVLFDQFLPEEEEKADLNRFLICRDMQRRLSKHLSIPASNPILNIDRLLRSEVISKEKDGDKESSIESNLGMLRDAGFEDLQLIFVEPRLFGVAAKK